METLGDFTALDLPETDEIKNNFQKTWIKCDEHTDPIGMDLQP